MIIIKRYPRYCLKFGINGWYKWRKSLLWIKTKQWEIIRHKKIWKSRLPRSNHGHPLQFNSILARRGGGIQLASRIGIEEEGERERGACTPHHKSSSRSINPFQLKAAPQEASTSRGKIPWKLASRDVFPERRRGGKGREEIFLPPRARRIEACRGYAL